MHALKLTLLVIGDGRREYLDRTIRSIRDHVIHPITTRVMVNDEADIGHIRDIDRDFGDWRVVHTCRQGMAGAVQAGFDAALDTDPDYVLWVEEDMLLTRRLPIRAAAEVLDNHPGIAQMSFRRGPLNDVETRHGCVLTAMVEQCNHYDVYADYTTHDWIFSLNPSLINPAVMKLGWPSGPLGVGNEAGFTIRCLQAGYVFGSWGQPGDGQTWCEHIGVGRSVKWQL